MPERDEIFRERLVTIVDELHHADGKDPAIQSLVGAYAARMAKEAGVAEWAALKERADGPTYDSMLKLFGAQSQKMSKARDTKGVRALEILALSLIARRQYQADLQPGIDFLDGYIAKCTRMVRRKGLQMLPGRPRAN